MLPPIPTSVYSALGPVPVVIVEGLTDDQGQPLLGHFLPEERRIEIKAGMSPTTTLVTLLHEKLHLWMWDSGASPLDEEEEEDICDALSVALLAETLAGP